MIDLKTLQPVQARELNTWVGRLLLKHEVISLLEQKMYLYVYKIPNNQNLELGYLKRIKYRKTKVGDINTSLSFHKFGKQEDWTNYERNSTIKLPIHL